MKKTLLVPLMLFIGACSSAPKVYNQTRVEKERPEAEVRTMLGYTIPQAREVMASTANPYEISISECYTSDGTYIPELNQLRLRLINDYTSRSGKKFVEEYRFQTLYPLRRKSN